MAEFISLARPLQNLATGDPRAITQTLLDATIAEAFEKDTPLYGSGVIGEYNLATGESAHRFPILGNSPEDGEFYIEGSATDGGTTKNTFVDIGIDDIWYKQLNLPKIDMILANWDIFAPTVREVGRIVAERKETLATRMMVLAARAAAISGIHAGGNVINVVNAGGVVGAFPVSNNGADAIELAISNLGRAMDDDDVPRGEGVRSLFVNTHVAQVLTFSNRLASTQVRGSAVDISNRTIGTMHGFSIRGITRFMPTTNITTGLTRYRGNFAAGSGTSEPVILAAVNTGSGKAVQEVKQGGVESKMWIDDETMDTRKVRSSFVSGFGIHCPWKAGVIQVATA